MTRLLSFSLLFAALAPAAIRILPSPRYAEEVSHKVRLAGSAQLIVGPAPAAADPRLRHAVRMIEQGLSVAVSDRASVRIHLWDFSRDPKPPVSLNFLDEDTLVDPKHFGQGYVLKTPDASTVWIVGASPQGVMWGAASLLQLLDHDAEGAFLQGAYLRDHPDFEFRAASDWLLNIEINGWDLDRGKGVEDFARLVEARIDRALRFKINMALMDGFGFGVSKRPAYYKNLMLRLNRYARARGFSLYFGGYGASYGMAYEPVVMYERGVAFKGEVYKNRRSYPDGPVYRCMGFPKARKGYEPAELGSCRSNDQLNARKAAELAEFVAAVEPGALYVHHEDFGGFDGTARAWSQRCEACRRRWPNDALAARDGGAGGLGHGYAALIDAVNRVRNPQSGYDAARDCQIILVSPVYIPDRPQSEDWANALELWRNIGQEIPKAANVQTCFREVYPLRHGGERFTERFASAMEAAGSPLRVFMFFAGGADRFVTDYPLTGAPAINALFLGSRGIYNASGDFYQEPMELINAEFSWNAHATGFRVPRTYDEAQRWMRRAMFETDQPAEIFAPDGLFDLACRRLYGDRAASSMAQYYRLSAILPESPAAPPPATRRPMTYLPLTWDRAYAAPSHWRRLIQDSLTWDAAIDDEVFAAAMKQMAIDKKELHRRMARRWDIMSRLNREALALIDTAIGAGPKPDSLGDLRFLKTLFAIYQPLFDSLAAFHHAWHAHLDGTPPPDLTPVLRLAARARQMADDEFPQPVDPVGGEVGALRRLAKQLELSIEQRRKEWTAR